LGKKGTLEVQIEEESVMSMGVKNGYAFPPYGLMTEGLQKNLNDPPIVPPDVFLPGVSMEDRKKWWDGFVRDTANLIRDNLWPEWDGSSRSWVGSSQAGMHELTRTDLRLIHHFKDNVLRVDQPSSPVKAPDCPKHIAFYRFEDDNGWLAKYALYDTTVATSLIQTLTDVHEARKWDKHGSAHLQFKVIFQRPRPSQTSFLLQEQPLHALRAISAGSPSMCSGHSLQALLGLGAVIEYIILNGVTLSSQSWHALRQMIVDLGDRRVFAGVHYPSDNLGSWIIAMRLADHVFRVPQVKTHLWAAISRQSEVYDEMLKYSAYAQGLDALKSAAANVEAEVPGIIDPQLLRFRNRD
jgi:hypothetical protein